ncbi:MAG: TerC family protein [Gammaproteobacteria bacterium]|nr:TerC family protein [Gammaproteobacteria bacterium]
MDIITNLLSTFNSLDAVASLFTLTILEVVLGIDNLIFLSILTNKLPVQKRKLARKVGLLFAMFSRLFLLFIMNWLTTTNVELFNIYDIKISIHSLIFAFGGLFLFYKAVREIHNDMEGAGLAEHGVKSSVENELLVAVGIGSVLLQVLVIDIIFSLDSVITAVGMTHNYTIMAIAIVISVFLMLFASEPLSNFVEKHPTIKMLALSFLILVGTMLMAQSIGYHVEKGYLYFAIAFSLLVECLNIRASKKRRLSK